MSSDLGKLWHLYLDDSTCLEWLDEQAIPSQAEEQQQQQPKFQKMLQPVYRDWGIPWSEDKSLSRRTKVVRLGAELDGDVGTLGAAGEKRMELFSLAFYLLGQERVTKKGVQVFLSSWCTCLNSEGLLFLLCNRFGRECFASHPAHRWTVVQA